MKTKIFNVFVIAFIITAVSCKGKADEATTEDAKEAATAKATAQKFTAKTDASTIEWKGFKPTGSHNGTISISKGVVSITDGAIESGNFDINMASINVLDIPAEDEGNSKLKGHLTSADFFDVEKFPTAKFEITGFKTVEGKTMLSGNLTMKDATNNISFPVTTKMNGDTMTLTSDTFTIDRSKWNVQYGSKSFFDNLGDKFINDDIELKVNLVATKS